MHGYLVRQEAVIDQTEAWADVKPGSIYNALHRMQREGLIEAVATEQKGGPARTVFGLTSEGRAALDQQIRQALEGVVTPADPFDVALRLADEVGTDDRREFLRTRRDGLARRVQVHQATLRDVRPHLTGWEERAFEHVVARLQFELDWTNDLVGRAEIEGGGQR